MLLGGAVWEVSGRWIRDLIEEDGDGDDGDFDCDDGDGNDDEVI